MSLTVVSGKEILSVSEGWVIVNESGGDDVTVLDVSGKEILSVSEGWVC